MNSISRGWLFIIGFALVAILVIVGRGLGARGDITGSVEVGPSATTNPGLPYAGTASLPSGVGGNRDDDDDSATDDEDSATDQEEEPDPVPTAVIGQAKGTVYVGGVQVLPLTGAAGDLSAFTGRQVTVRAVEVQSVDADEGFWIGSSGDRVWVQLVGPPPESPEHVAAGYTVSFVGRVVAHGKGFAAKVGVDRSEGAASLISQGAHIEVRKRKLSVAS